MQQCRKMRNNSILYNTVFDKPNPVKSTELSRFQV